MNKFPTLYSKSQTGKTLIWHVEVKDDSYEVSFGEEGGKQQVNRTQCYAKNEGRANATSPSEQALKEAQALWTKQQERKNYTLSKDSTPTFKPVLLRDYRKVGHQVDWNNDKIYVQNKLDGMRITQQDNRFISRTGVELNLPHIPKLPVNVDGEFYIHGQPLNQILSAVKKPNALTEQIKLYVFDIVDPTKTFEERLEILNSLQDHPAIVVVPTMQIQKDDLDEVHDEAVKQGYEGIVLKLGHGVYEPNTRSKYMFKYKKFQDDEFLITGVTSDKRDQAVLTCLTHDGQPFSVRCMGTDAYREYQLANPSEFIGKYLTVKFQYYSEYGIPIFPVGVALRGG